MKKKTKENKTLIITNTNEKALKYLFCFFVVSTKLLYSSIRFVLMFNLLTKTLTKWITFVQYLIYLPNPRANIVDKH